MYMGQIVFNGQKPKYCNLTAITTGSKKDYLIPDGEIWLIDSTNTSKTDGTGKYDYYIKGDGSNTASQLAANKIKVDDSIDISGKADKSEMSVVAGTGANADKTTITLKNGTSATVLTQHQDVSEFLKEGEVFGEGDDSTASFNSYSDTVWNKQQTLSESQKQQIRDNIGVGAADNEDIQNVNGTLKFADRAYTATTSSVQGNMGYKILRKGSTFASQVTSTNTIYEIRYDYDLNGQTVTLPANCVLKFNGGKLSNGIVVGDSTDLKADIVEIFTDTLTLSGTWKIKESFPEWYGASVGVSVSAQTAIKNSQAIELALSIPSNKLVLCGLYGISRPIGISDRVQVIAGRHAVDAQRFGIFCTSAFTSIEYDGNNVSSMFYGKTPIGAPTIFQDAWFSGSYHASTCVGQYAGHFVGIRMYRCYVFRFYDCGIVLNASDTNVLSETKFQFCGVGVSGEGKTIDYSHPLLSPTTVKSRPNHSIITKCQFHRNNVGLVFAYCSDVLLSDNLFGYNSLASMFFYECHVVNIRGNYIEGDCNYKFKIYKDRAGDPPSNSEISLGQEVEESLLDMDVEFRSYIRIINSVAWIDEMFNSNYYIRCYEGGDGNNYTNQNISGFDSIIYISGVESKLQIGGMKNMKSMTLGEVKVGNIYDIVSYDSNQIIKEIPINSTTMLKYRNFETPYNTDIIRGMRTDCFSVGQEIPFGLETRPDAVSPCIHPTDYSWDFFQYFNYTHKYRDVEYYKIQINNQQRNTLRIDFNSLNAEVTYKLEICYYNISTTAFNVQAHYSDGTSETIKLNSNIPDVGYKKLVYYFTKNQFVRDEKNCTYIYIVNTTPTNSSYPAEISAIRLYIVGNPVPICMSNKLIGAYRPTPKSDEMVVFFDTTLGKPIYWKGSAWVDATGAAV